jgi:hypothetical protein
LASQLWLLRVGEGKGLGRRGGRADPYDIEARDRLEEKCDECIKV